MANISDLLLKNKEEEGGGGGQKMAEQEDKNDDLLLELNLGLIGSASSRASSSCSTNQERVFIKLGLGFVDDVIRTTASTAALHNKGSHDDNVGLLTQTRAGPLMMNLPRVIVPTNAAQRPHAGLWFTLRSLISREGEILPQIPKAYIRVKDDNVTVLMVKTYLLTKLGLCNEAQVEISCMGQILAHSQTLKHVRDQVWFPRLIQLYNSQMTSIKNDEFPLNHVMCLDYARF